MAGAPPLALLLATLVLTTALTGCLGSPSDDEEGLPEGVELGPGVSVPPPGPQRTALFNAMLASGPAHDHGSPAEHQRGFNLNTLDHLPLGAGGDRPAGIQALAIHGDLLYAARTLLAEPPGFVVVDVSDPTSMEVVGEWTDPDATGGDRSIDVSEDGRWAFLANEGAAATQAGVRMLDVSDLTNIREVAFYPMYGGAHTVDSLTIDGTVYVFALNFGVTILRVVDLPVTGPQLVHVARWTIPTEEMSRVPEGLSPADTQRWELRALYGHDMRAVHDEELGPLLYVAYAYQGLHVLDITTPEAPRPLTRWVPEGEGAPWYTHSVETEDLDGRRIVVVGTEVFEDRHVDTPSPLWVLDMSTLDEPELLSTWTNPAGVGADHLLFSLHWFRLDQGILHVSHYHGGTWVLDISTPERRQAPHILGAFTPAGVPGLTPSEACCFGFNLAAVPVTFDVATKDGVTYAADLQSGLYALRVVDPSA